jgi:hypothetical protein
MSSSIDIITPVSIVNEGWGYITTSDGLTYKDVILDPYGSIEWNWNHISGDPMHHDPGLRISDIDKLILPYNPEVVILTTGRSGVLKVSDSIKSYLLKQGVRDVIIKETEEACKYYNSICNKYRTVALIHSTC